MSIRRGTAALAGLVLGIGLVASCGAPTPASGPSVEVFGTFTDRDARHFADALVPFERASGIDVRYVGSSSFEADLLARVKRGDPPDLALLPQPGLLEELVRLGAVEQLDGDLDRLVAEAVDPRLDGLGTVDGKRYAAWFRLTLKSLVWYSPRTFAARGWTAPRTWAELETLSGEATAAGITPWCIGVRDGAASGWVATDWVEDILLRTAGPDVYDRWVTGDVRFADPPVRDAVDRFGRAVRNPLLVDGGAGAAVERTVAQAAEPLLDDPPGCVLHKQAGFLPELLDRPVRVAPDGDLWVFPLPAADGSDPPMLIGGLLVARFTDRPEVDAVTRVLLDPDTVSGWAAEGGFLSPLRAVEPTDYPRPLERMLHEWWLAADVVRFDASDRMPAPVGVGAFWTGMTAYLGGADLDATLAAIDDAWPRPSGDGVGTR